MPPRKEVHRSARPDRAPDALMPLSAAGEPMLGLSLKFAAPGIIECMGHDWDFIWIDGQHGQFTFRDVLDAVRTCRAMGLSSLLRVPGNAPDLIGQYADAAASGLMIPMINTVAQAEEAVDAACFPPLGQRSFGGRRPIDLGGRDYYLARGPALVVQLETPESLEHAEAMAAVDGVDGLFLGADDLRIRLGLPVNRPIDGDPRLEEAFLHTARVAAAAGKWAGCAMMGGADSVARALDAGYKLVAVGGDSGFLAKGSRDLFEACRIRR